jgi:hypothetical protein
MNLNISPTRVGLVRARKPTLMSPVEFFQAVGVDDSHPSGVQGFVFDGQGGKPHDLSWCPPEAVCATWPAANTIGCKPAYFTTAAACYLDRKEQTARAWACLENGHIRPMRVHGPLARPDAELRRILGGTA